MGLTDLDYDEIRDLFARYSQTFDLGDATGFAACFAPDGTLDATHAEEGLTGIHQGREELRRFVATAVEFYAGRVRHSALNSLIEGNGDSAKASSYVIITRDYGPPNAPGHFTHSMLASTGMFFDELIKLDGRWLIARREFRHDGLPEVAERIGNAVTVGPVSAAVA